MVHDWRGFLSSAASDKETAGLRKHERTGRPLGDESKRNDYGVPGNNNEVRIWSTKYEKGCKLLLYCNFFGLNPDDFTITPDNNRVTGLFML